MKSISIKIISLMVFIISAEVTLVFGGILQSINFISASVFFTILSALVAYTFKG
jgi:hypothetical protein